MQKELLARPSAEELSCAQQLSQSFWIDALLFAAERRTVMQEARHWSTRAAAPSRLYLRSQGVKRWRAGTADPYLIASALHYGATIISEEVDRGKKYDKIRLPHIARALGVPTISLQNLLESGAP